MRDLRVMMVGIVLVLFSDSCGNDVPVSADVSHNPVVFPLDNPSPHRGDSSCARRQRT